MKRLFTLATAVTLLAGAEAWAKDKYTFGAVPPPSSFPDLTTATNRIAPPRPVLAPSSGLNALVPLPRSQATLPVYTPPPTSVAPPPVKVVTPAPVKVTPPPKITPPKIAPPVAVIAPVAKPAPPEALEVPALPKNTTGSKLITSLGGGMPGKLVLVDDAGRFAVVNFPLGQMPGTNQTFAVYRNGVSVGTVVIVGPQRDDNIIADVISGTLQTGDEARRR